MTILFITYYFPPCNSIASNRTQSFYESLISAHHKVTVVSRGWMGNENTWTDYTAKTKNDEIIKKQTENSCIYYLPYNALPLNNNNVLQKTKTTVNFLNGNFNPEVNVTSFYSFCDELLQKETFTHLLISSPPINSVKLGYLLKKKHPYLKLIVDFRDLQNHILLPEKPIVKLPQKIEHYFISTYLKKWLSVANNIIVASEPFATFLSKYKFQSQLILNGFEDKLLNLPEVELSKKFSITVLGTIYPTQELDFFIATLKGFVADKSVNKIEINLIGVNAITEVANVLEQHLKPFCYITKKLPRNEALQIGKKSSVLIYPGWKNYKGMYSGKIFDYLALKRHILIAPSDNDVIEKIVNECEAGKCINTIQDGIDYLNELYNQWLNNTLLVNSNNEKIYKYSREQQNLVLLNLL